MKTMQERFIPERIRNFVKWTFFNADKLCNELKNIYCGEPPEQIVWAALAATIVFDEMKQVIDVPYLYDAIRASLPSNVVPSNISTFYLRLYRAGCCLAQLCTHEKKMRRVLFHPTAILRDLFKEVLRREGILK